MTFLSDLLSSLIPWLLAVTLGCSFLILILRCLAEPFAPGISFGPLVRRLVNHQALETPSPLDDDEPSIASRQLRRRLRRNRWAFHMQFRLIAWILCVMLLSRLLILAAAMVGSCLLGSLDQLFQAAISHWVRWDASSYIDIARNGYSAASPELLNLLPLYPLVVRAVAFLCFGHYVFAGFLVSNLCLLIAAWALYHICNGLYGERAARRAVLLLLFAPLSLTFSVPYAESMFLMFTLLAILFARNRYFLPAAVFGMLSCATRLIGVLVFIPIYMEALKYLHNLDLWRRNRPRFFGRLTVFTLICLMVFWGTGSYLLLNQIVAGSPFAFVETLESCWSQTVGSILDTQRYSIELAFGFSDLAWRLGTWIPQALSIFLVALALLAMSTSIQPADGLYGWFYLVLTMMPSWMLSGPRTLTAMYPLYIMMAIASRKKWNYIILMLSSIVLLCYFSYLYALVGSVV